MTDAPTEEHVEVEGQEPLDGMPEAPEAEAGEPANPEDENLVVPPMQNFDPLQLAFMILGPALQDANPTRDRRIAIAQALCTFVLADATRAQTQMMRQQLDAQQGTGLVIAR